MVSDICGFRPIQKLQWTITTKDLTCAKFIQTMVNLEYGILYTTCNKSGSSETTVMPTIQKHDCSSLNAHEGHF